MTQFHPNFTEGITSQMAVSKDSCARHCGMGDNAEIVYATLQMSLSRYVRKRLQCVSVITNDNTGVVYVAKVLLSNRAMFPDDLQELLRSAKN